MNNALKHELIKKYPELEKVEESGMSILATFWFKEFSELTDFLERVHLKYYTQALSIITKKNQEIEVLKGNPKTEQAGKDVESQIEKQVSQGKGPLPKLETPIFSEEDFPEHIAPSSDAVEETETFQFDDLSDLNEEEKTKFLNESTKEIAKYYLAVFMTLGLKTHIEQMVIEENSGKEFIFSFRTLSEHLNASECSLNAVKEKELLAGQQEPQADSVASHTASSSNTNQQ